MPSSFFVVYVTTPNKKTASSLARSILSPRLAACINIISGISSHYWWKGKIEKSVECLMMIKTTKKNLPKLFHAIRQQHPYDTPEIIATSIEKGNPAYLAWIDKETQR